VRILIKILWWGFLFLWTLPAWGQDRPIEISDVRAIMSTEMKGMEGQLCEPHICPSDTGYVSFQRLVKNSEELYILDVISGKITRVTSSPEAEKKDQFREEFSGTPEEGVDFQLDWRPVPDKDGNQWYVFVGDGGVKNFDLYLGVIGKEKKIKLTEDDRNYVDVQPKWSPDGKQIVFVSSRTGNGDLYLIENVDKVIEQQEPPSKPLQLTTNSGLDVYPVWNPDIMAGYIAYTAESVDSRSERKYSINLYDLYLHLVIPVITTPTPGFDYTRPSWDPATGSYLSYFVSEALSTKGGIDLKGGIAADQTAKIGISKFSLGDKQKLEISAVEGENRYIASDVVPPDYTGPLWLPGSRYVMYVRSKLEQFNPIYVANLKDWQSTYRSKFSYKVDQEHQMPVDLSIEKDKIVYACQDGKEYKIILGMLDGWDFDIRESEHPIYALGRPEMRQEYLEGRIKTTGSTTTIKHEGLLKWLMGPIVGKNTLLFLNRRITPIVVGAGVAAYVLWPKKQEKSFNWTPPAWPKKISYKIVF
jgi:hypothetical protein